MTKKTIYAFVCYILCLLMIACSGNASASSKQSGSNIGVFQDIPLTNEEKEILKAMGSDVNIVSDADYVQTVTELVYHTHEYIGKVYQIEGVFNSDGENVSVYRSVINKNETINLGLPLRYLEKDIKNGSWVCVTGIIAEDNANGNHNTVFDIVAIETKSKYGQAEIEWDGSPIHQH